MVKAGQSDLSRVACTLGIFPRGGSPGIAQIAMYWKRNVVVATTVVEGARI